MKRLVHRDTLLERPLDDDGTQRVDDRGGERKEEVDRHGGIVATPGLSSKELRNVFWRGQGSRRSGGFVGVGFLQ